jgi:hypothetical protein
MKKFALCLNYLVLILFVLTTFTCARFGHMPGYLLAAVSVVISFGVWKQTRWGYFATAAFGLACYQLAKQGYQFQDLKREAMILGILIIPVAIFLHELLARTKPENGLKD